MQSTSTTTRRLALLPIAGRTGDRQAIRRYTLGRIIDDLGAAVANAPAPRVQAPASGVRAP